MDWSTTGPHRWSGKSLMFHGGPSGMVPAILIVMNTDAIKTFIHPTYAAAMVDLKRRKTSVGLARWDAGEGYVAEGEWSSRLGRVITRTYNPDGSRCA